MALSMTTGSGRGRGGKNLTCGVCREIYRCPRLLPCFHTFCLYCVERLIRTHGTQSQFPCPQCRRSTPVPPEGALGFQMNFYISEEELELERKGPSATMCSTESHGLEPLVFFCLQCDSAICIRCKLTKHEGHDTEDLCKAAARCQSRLKTSKERLDDTISYLKRKSEEALGNIKAAKRKRTAIEQEVQAQRDALVAKADKWRDAVLGEVRQANDTIDRQLATDEQKIRQELDSLLQLQQHIDQALGEAPDAKKVCVEKEMRDGQGSEKHLDRVKECVPVTTVRPGLHYDHSFISEDDIRQFLGSPVQLSMPCAAASEVIVPIYRCGQDGAFREVHSVCYVNANKICISYGGTSPDYAAEQQVAITSHGKCDKYSSRPLVLKGVHMCRVSFLKCCCDKTCYEYSENSKYMLNAKRGALFRAQQSDSKTVNVDKIDVQSSESLEISCTHLFAMHSGKPAAFDATKDGQLFVVIEENANVELPQKTERTVLLFHRDDSDPFTTYTPSDAGFMPADVCFWQDNGQTKLLVADPQNDCVHVVNIEDDGCRFERYLAAGSGDLICPTALDVDDHEKVWIGCGNGWILRCQKLQDHEEAWVEDDGEPHMDNFSVSEESDDDSFITVESAVVSCGSPPVVEISSPPTDAQN